MHHEALKSALIIDSDPGSRHLIATVLGRAGFQVSAVEDATAATGLLQRFVYDAVVREVNLAAPVDRDRALEQLLSTTAAILRRTVVTTTSSARTKAMIGPGRVFAVVSKPFDMDEFVDAVRRCAGESRDHAIPAGGFRDEGEARVKLDTVRRFVDEVPTLRRLLVAPVGSMREAALRTEMRRTIGALSAVLDHAARTEASRTRAAVLRDASAAAAQLMAQPAHARRSSERDH